MAGMGYTTLEVEKYSMVLPTLCTILTQMISTLDWETLEACHHVAHLDMLFTTCQQCY